MLGVPTSLLPQRLGDVVDLVSHANNGVHEPLTRDIPPVRPILQVPGFVPVDAGGILGMSPAHDHASSLPVSSARVGLIEIKWE